MIFIFIGISGYVSTIAVDDIRTDNAERFTPVCSLRVLQNEIEEIE